LWCEPTEPAKQAFGVDRAELVQGDKAGSTLKSDTPPAMDTLVRPSSSAR